LISGRRFDALVPIHEQGLLFAKVEAQLTPHVALALPSFQRYKQVVSKTGFDQLLSQLGLPRPRTRYISSSKDLRRVSALPCVVKMAIGTASRGTWIVHNSADWETVAIEIEERQAFVDPVLVQDFIAGPVEHAQAVFCHGRLVGIHMYRQIVRGAGGGDAVKDSVYRPDVRMHLGKIGKELSWHGALSVDYIVSDENGMPHYVDCNPRLVEPMSAALAGADLASLLVRVSLDDTPEGVLIGQPGIRSHLAMQVLFGSALRTGSRRELLRECYHLAMGRGPYASSQEELTPFHLDKLSVVPLLVAAAWLLADPSAAHYLPAKGWGKHLLNAQSIREIEERIGSP
jgi:predicted ATP-grasp superfamily ATP-dependent carboligase